MNSLHNRLGTASRSFVRVAALATFAMVGMTSLAVPAARGQGLPIVTQASPVATAQPVYYYTRSYAPVATPAPVVYQQPAVTYAAPTYNTYPTYTAAPTYAAPTTYTQPAAAPVATGGGDAYGFTAWLNNLRASYGLAPVSHDSGLAGWAAANNAQQQSRGLGHHVMGPSARQNAAVGTAASIGAQWLNSPAHRALLLDPSIRTIGLAGAGMYWTLNAR